MMSTTTAACSAVASRSAAEPRRRPRTSALPNPGSIRIPVPLTPRALQRSRRSLHAHAGLAPIRALGGLPDASKLPTYSSSEDDDDDDDDDADVEKNENRNNEVAVLLAACGVGIATGLGVVLLNDAIDAVRALAWAGAPLEATHWGRWARSLPLEAALPLVLLPPTAAGLAVGALRAAAGGSLDDDGSSSSRRAGSSSSSDIKVKAPLLRAAAAALSLGELVDVESFVSVFFRGGRGRKRKKTHPLFLSLSPSTTKKQAAEPPWAPRAPQSTSASPSRGAPPLPSSPKKTRLGGGPPSLSWRRAPGPASPRASAPRSRGPSSRSRRCSCGGGREKGRMMRLLQKTTAAAAAAPRDSPSRQSCWRRCSPPWPPLRG